MHSIPTKGISNQGDVQRLAVAVQAFIPLLSADPRVDLIYGTWRAGLGLDGALLERIRANFGRPDPEPQTPLDVLAFGEALDRDFEKHRAKVQALVRALPFPAYEWLPDALHAQFRVRLYSEVTGDAQMIAVRPPASAETMPKGRAARTTYENGDIARNVEWYYRAEIKEPPDTKAALAKEYQRRVNRCTSARSVVQNGIRQAKALLALAVTGPSTK